MVQGDSKLVRSIRLVQIQHLLYKNPRGLTTRELADLCGVCIRTIQRDMLCLQSDLGIPLTQHGDRYGILESYILPPVTFSLYEAMALFLACRLILRQTDERNEHIQAALTKLAAAMPSGLACRLQESIDAIGKKPANPDYIAVFKQVAIAWATQRRMLIHYQSLRSHEKKEWLLDPYFVEMTGVGYSTYVIGHAKHKDREGIITFKLDRIKGAELLEESFETPEGMNLEKLLDSSWGVMWEETTNEVKLKFSPLVSRRVKESIWHPSQMVEDLPDGSCLLTMWIGNTLEMTPWIRGWGPDVEVLEPEELRQHFKHWADELARIYR